MPMNMTATRINTGNGAAISSRAGIVPERFTEEISRGRREEHTQKKFVPVAMNGSLLTKNRRKLAVAKPQPLAGAQGQWPSPSTLQLNRSNVKHKPAARGRTR